MTTSGAATAGRRTFDALRQFCALQAGERPDWHIDVLETMELADVVVVRASAGGTVVVDGRPQRKRVGWLGRCRVQNGVIREIGVLALVDVTAE